MKTSELRNIIKEEIENIIKEEFPLKSWFPFDANALSDIQSNDVQKYSTITKQTPDKIYIRGNNVSVSFKPKMYSLSKEQIDQLSKIEFSKYKMDDYGVSILTF